MPFPKRKQRVAPSRQGSETGSVKGRAGWGSSLWPQMLSFGVVGMVGFLVNAGIVEALAPRIGPGWAQSLAFPVAASATWWLNRRYTFGASRNSWQREWMWYLAANFVGWLANNGTYFLMIFSYSFIYHHPAIAVATGSLGGMVFNFIFSKRFVFDQS